MDTGTPCSLSIFALLSSLRASRAIIRARTFLEAIDSHTDPHGSLPALAGLLAAMHIRIQLIEQLVRPRAQALVEGRSTAHGKPRVLGKCLVPTWDATFGLAVVLQCS